MPKQAVIQRANLQVRAEQIVSTTGAPNFWVFYGSDGMMVNVYHMVSLIRYGDEILAETEFGHNLSFSAKLPYTSKRGSWQVLPTKRGATLKERMTEGVIYTPWDLIQGVL